MLTGRTTASVFAAIAARFAVVVLLVFSNAFFVRARGIDPAADARVRVTFPFDSAELRSDYMSNESAISTIDEILNSSEGRVDVQIVSYSSPEGPEAYNLYLSKLRANSVKNYILAAVPGANPSIRIASYAEAWEQFRAYIVSDKTLTEESRLELLLIVDSDNSLDEKEALIKADPNYKALYRRYFRSLRYADISLRIKNLPQAVESAVDTAVSQADTMVVVSDTLQRLPRLDSISTKAVRMGEDAPVIITRTREPERDTLVRDSVIVDDILVEYVEVRNMIAAVKTNLLYDAFTAVNAEIEIPVWENVSLMWEVTTPWWETGNKYAFELFMMGGEIRYWFNPWEQECSEKLRGLFVGPYLASGIYDFQFDKSINYQTPHVGRDVEEGFWSAGLTAGFAMPVGREKKVNLEFSLSAGYLYAPYQRYYPADDYSKLYKDLSYGARANKKYFGPTKAKISLVVPITIPTGKKKEVRYE
ncbi:MAG: DUF3575 domain-containing protein [Bacteroidales bacterium]|nr:DUF3575 domain-containing protein [Bacteroidales bacterium]